MSTLVNTSSTEISVVKQKHDELLKKSLLTRSQFEGQLKEKSKVISDLKVKEGKDIDTMIEMEKQIKFLNEILYKRNQSIQTIHMLAPKCATYNGRSTFANPKYLKKAQSDKPRLYEIPYDTSDPANRFCPDGEETVTLEKESKQNWIIDKDDFTNIYELLPRRGVFLKMLHVRYLHSLSDLNANTELQCLYLHKVKECECLAQKLSKQTESVNKEVHNNLLKSFSKLEKHSISLELALQQCKEQMKNNSVCKENGSNVFRKEREQYHEIQDLKAQMQDKNIAISELKKLIENCKGKSVETQFNKPSVVRQPNAQRIPKPSVLGKSTPFSNSPEMRSFQTKQSVNKTNVSDGLFKQVTQQNLPQIRKQAVRNTNLIAPGPSRNCPKHVSHQSPREKVGSNDMVHNYYLEKAKKSAQLQKDKEVNGKPSMIDPARLPNTANGCKPKPRRTIIGFLVFLRNKSVTACNDSSNSRTSNVNVVCAECGKCVFNSNHDACIVQLILFIVDSGCTKHMRESQAVVENIMIKSGLIRRWTSSYSVSRIWSICDADLEVASGKSTCFVRDLQGKDLLTVPQDEDEREPMFVQAHDPDYVPEPIYPEYIPLEDEHEFPAEEQPLPPVYSPTAESPRYVIESDLEEDPEELLRMMRQRMDEDDKDEEEEEEHLASVDSAIVVPVDELFSPLRE
ncbi:hypothetical protein Tco_0128475 [Tanacetum coccineum]